MAKIIISTPHAPAAIGTYSQAVRVGDTVYMSGQIGLDPASMQMVDGIDAKSFASSRISRRWPRLPVVRWPMSSSSTSS